MAQSVRAALRAPADLDLTAIDPRGKPLGPKDKAAAASAVTELAEEKLERLQEALYAEAVLGGNRAVLLVLQGMDTSGKGGTIRHVAGLVNPQGLRVAAFGRPTSEELAHDFLWRVRKEVPRAGRIAVFDRSHYEDVLVARVDSLVPEPIWRARYGRIREFEAELVDAGVTVLKCFLHISPQEQVERLIARLDEPDKRWKYNPSDVDARAQWPSYREAYHEAIAETDSDAAPWYVVPADRKWYRNWAVAALLTETLAELAPTFPVPDIDVEAEKARVLATRAE